MSRSRHATSQQQTQGQGHGCQGHGSTVVAWILGGRPYDKSSIDSQFAYVGEVRDLGLTPTPRSVTLPLPLTLSSPTSRKN